MSEHLTMTCQHGVAYAQVCRTCNELELEYDRLNETAKAPPRGNWKKDTWRGTTNRNERGNTKQRAQRRAWVLEVYACAAVPGGPALPGLVRCYRCGIRLTESTMTIDRILPGCQGGTYSSNNIRPACSTCNSVTGATTRAT